MFEALLAETTSTSASTPHTPKPTSRAGAPDDSDAPIQVPYIDAGGSSLQEHSRTLHVSGSRTPMPCEVFVWLQGGKGRRGAISTLFGLALHWLLPGDNYRTHRCIDCRMRTSQGKGMLVQSTGIGLTSPCPESPCLHGRTSAKRFSLVHESPALQEQPLRLVTGVLMASIFGITNCFV